VLLCCPDDDHSDVTFKQDLFRRGNVAQPLHLTLSVHCRFLRTHGEELSSLEMKGLASIKLLLPVARMPKTKGPLESSARH